MPSVTALRRWLVFVALLRLLSGGQSISVADVVCTLLLLGFWLPALPS